MFTLILCAFRISLHVKYELRVSSTAINDHMTTLTCEKRRGISNTSFYAFQKNFDEDNSLAGSHRRTRPWLFDMMKGQKVGASSESRLAPSDESPLWIMENVLIALQTLVAGDFAIMFFMILHFAAAAVIGKSWYRTERNPICEQSHGTSLWKEDEVKSGSQQERKKIFEYNELFMTLSSPSPTRCGWRHRKKREKEFVHFAPQQQHHRHHHRHQHQFLWNFLIFTSHQGGKRVEEVKAHLKLSRIYK